ncbi:MAG: ribulose-phosphate 3-epimerase [Bacteroidales bacterium]|nr:ribulose-phosphate 3-epimerase [Bacteroidales bacterium]MBD5247222.1 ribulose-phosphate 3-epimerase [Barnesiella sp.]
MLVSPSLLSADFGNLDCEVDMLNRSNADMIHLDVMDGVFVPNISFGFPVIEAVAKRAEKPLDVHLMIVHPENYIDRLRDAGATIMNVHQEACLHLDRTINAIKKAGMKAAVTLNPSTPVMMLEDVIADLDMVLVMSVNPGFSGQKFISNAVEKTRRLRELIERTGSKALIEVDGGVNEVTGAALAEAGADILVAGNYVFKSDNPAEAIDRLKAL